MSDPQISDRQNPDNDLFGDQPSPEHDDIQATQATGRVEGEPIGENVTMDEDGVVFREMVYPIYPRGQGADPRQKLIEEKQRRQK